MKPSEPLPSIVSSTSSGGLGAVGHLTLEMRVQCITHSQTVTGPSVYAPWGLALYQLGVTTSDKESVVTHVDPTVFNGERNYMVRA